jgi:hypothetical protein
MGGRKPREKSEKRCTINNGTGAGAGGSFMYWRYLDPEKDHVEPSVRENPSVYILMP